MKKLFLLASITLWALLAFTQVPDAFNYQAVVRNTSGEIIENSNVSFRISIVQNSESGAAVYTEIHSVQTNSFGLVTLKIGKGTKVSGSFNPANWGSNSHFIKVEFDSAGGTSYSHLGTSELLSVPYAFHSKTVENDKVDDADADATNEIQALSISGTQLTLSKNGGTVTLPSSGGGDNWGTQNVVSDATLSGEGTSANPLGVTGDLTDNQTLSIKNNELSIKNGNTVTLPTNESIWKQDNTDIYYNSGKITIGNSTPNTNGILTIHGQNNSSFLSFNNNATGNTLNDGFTVGPTASNHAVYLWNFENKPIIFATNNNERLTISEDGNIGIGTQDPVAKLHIADGGIWMDNNEYGIRMQSSTFYSLTNDAGNLLISNFGYGEIHLRTSTIMGMANSKLTVKNNGFIGIGTQTPQSFVDINSGSNAAFLALHNSATGVSNTDGFTLGTTNNNSQSYIWNHENTPIKIATNNTTRMTIAANGYLGIGTETPSSGIHLKNSGYPGSFMYLEANAGQDAGFRLYEGSTAKWHIFNNATAGGLQIYNTGGQTAIFAKQSNSYVGIGTTSPTQALHVVGNAYKTVGGTSWATSSDLRLKNIKGSYNKGLKEITSLQAVEYIYKENNPRQLSSTDLQVGFVAQEVQKIFPEAVSEAEDGYLDFNIHPINIALVNAIKELKKENDLLRNKSDLLESRLSEIETLLKISASK